ncbi:hypothetical protein Daus18300_012594 [Diaporthe australafricana]|uniref:T6SS Phospholipase effector Tle1-like catalytic domain-containing protein n=1 Tax=Diaporthe australafricana TaxID=127596 RepID=A0ABR3W252_9PEZI
MFSQTDRVPKTKDVLTDWYQVLNAPFEAAWPTEDLVARMVSINYAYISMRVHPKKDRIFILGFSRGAYISQITASLVADVGILTYQKYLDYCGNNPGKSYTRIVYEIVRGWIECQGNHVKLKAKLGRYKDCLVPMNVEFLGLFDTVASVGLSDLGTANLQSKRFCFAEEINSRPRIINAYHAVAISEHRNQFKPVLWKKGSPDSRRNIAQVWFPGYHTSIGGGSDEQGIMISFITLVWMLSKCTGLAHAVKEQELTNMINADAKHAVSMRNKEIPDSRKGAWARPVVGDHVRKELGLSTIDRLHRICDEDQWRVRCAPKMPSIRGLGEVRIQRTQEMLDKRQFDTGNKFETRFLDKMVKIMSTQLADSGPSANRQGRRQASTVDQAHNK